MDHEREIYGLSAETLAIQRIVACVLSRIAIINPAFDSAIKLGFNDAASEIENMTFKFGKAASPDHLVKALAIVEQLRTATLGHPDKPTHGV